MNDKKQLRHEMISRRKSMSGEQRAVEQSAIDAALLKLIDQWDGAIAAYMAMPGECSCQALIDFCWQHQRPVFLPKVQKQRHLTWHSVTGADQLQKGAYDILEPMTAAQSLPDNCLLMTPGVAFNADGQRLGMGGGFYDTVLAKLPKTSISIGLAWQCQLTTEIPTESHDCRVQHVLLAGAWQGAAPLGN